ncbi:MAG TPA: hypothetical protein VMT24_08235 [Aggregatilineaceae bacterium]|nr:hypothetical protein [Aggregatilineaceae bacterium]
MKRYMSATLIAALVLVGSSLGAVPAVLAQPYSVAGFYTIGLCSTVDYDAVAAKALNLAPSDLRLALVSGQALDDIARRQNVALDTVKQALLTAHFTEIDRAVSDGLLDAQQAKQLKTLLTSNQQMVPRPVNPPNTALYPVYQTPADIVPYNFEAVKVLMAAAPAVDLNCADLVKELLNNRSIVAVVTARGGQIGAIIDVMIKAYQDALDQDVKEQLITAAQAKGLRVQLASRVTSLVNQVGQPVLLQILSLQGAGQPVLPQPYAAQPGGVASSGPLPAVGAPSTAPSTAAPTAVKP